MDEEATTEETDEATVVTPKTIQDLITTGIGYLAKTNTPYSGMVTKYKTSDWTKWPQTSNWYKGLHSLQLARTQAGICTYSDMGVSAYGK